jgi:peptidase C13-like protein
VWSAYKLSLRNGIRRRALVALTVLIGWTLALAVVRIAIPHVEAAPAQAVKAADTGAARAERAQTALLQAAVARLAPQQPGTTDIYALGVAGWAELDVFPKEIDGAFAALAQILPIRDRTLRLVNHAAAAKTTPLATRRNFAAAVKAIARRMDKEEDVLLLVMSSHGTSGASGGFSLQLPDGSMQVLTPHELKSVLDGEGIKNRIVIVSACFSGKFVWPLANDNTIVLTAADAMSTSFGCAAGRDWTYFGDALFRQSIQPGTNLARAFDHARVLIHGWETMDRLPPSNPQAHFGPALVAKLEPVLQAVARAGQ